MEVDLVTISDDEDDELSLVNHSEISEAKLKTSCKSKLISTSSCLPSNFTETASERTIATDIMVGSVYSQKDENSNEPFQKKIQNEDIDLAVAEIKKKNELLATFAETCLNLENNQGMLRIITRKLMKTYNQADKTYIKSNDFKRVLNKAICCIKSNPNKKFFFVKNLCDTLGSKRSECYLTENTVITILGKHKSTSEYNGTIKRSKLDSIVIDSEEDSDVIISDVIDLDDVALNNAQNSKQPASVQRHSEDEKENIADDEILAERDVNSAKNDEDSVEMLLTPNYEQFLPLDPMPCRSIEDLNSSQCSEELDYVETEYSVEVREKIKTLEQLILAQKMRIKELDEQEVDLDVDCSTYIKCEKAKETVVKFYKELCELTGTQSVKKTKVSLQVMEGHPPGPTKKLEEFINNNIGNNGLPPFPDFCDVVKCVLDASAEDGLGWKKAQVLKEASALFTQCGSALQKRRMQREYRDLITLVKTEQLASDDDDPANKDPELMRKLEENRRIAHRKENEILERYTMLQFQPVQPKPAPASNTETRQDVTVLPTTSSHPKFTHNNTTEFIDSANNQCISKPDNENRRRIQPILHVGEKRNGLITTENNHIERQVKCNERNALLPNTFAQVINVNKEKVCDDSVKSDNKLQTSTDTSKTVKLDLNNAVVIVHRIDGAGHPVQQNNTDLMDIIESDSSDNDKSDVDSGNDSHSDHQFEHDMIKLVNTDDVTNHVNVSLTAVNNDETNHSKDVWDTGSTNTDSNINTVTNNNTSLNTADISNIANISLNSNIANNSYTASANESGINSDVNQSVVKVKKERVDIYQMLEDLGDDFTATVLEIEDPFLVIEILSDSEEETNHGN